MSKVIQPGSTLGVLGSGQLGRMFTIAARRMGYRVHVLSPDDDTPTGQVADVEIRANYDDLDAIEKFAQGVSVVTFEFENVPSPTTTAAEKFAPVRPGGHVLHVTQNRLREKDFLRQQGIGTTPYHAIHNEQQLRDALPHTGYPAVLKTADWGYDGKGQAKIQRAEEISGLWPKFAGQESILEAFVDFSCEISVVGARGCDGDFVAYGPIHNSHRNHILDVSICPAPVSERVANEAIEITRTIFEKLDVVGVLCVEFFVTRDDRLLVNELAPRPHNSGHFGIDACVSCQFEQQVRAVCGLPLGSVRQHRPAAMVNLLGDVWQPNSPRWDQALRHPDIKLHLYGKAEPRPGRKMGHLTALADTPQAAAELALEARAALQS
ncbi:N5-carboxyaminoimidazole ribonucleotide synthase [Anatilimnocola aggregata]|uniref:N5-carboxyaminoimidazole ribonucleotide synthase n=1 Tax=Anatilimnocola aggregata TaxID=2528021 RepID=A0A517Y7B8_9BACT|nr:5-(carboxyamino)imidazole ribonucleotide synthase [Anatilimnocola aggregata]QDU26130.1 N5-carboxyaminoimidazole ribonucleotide synthase [Anatilimnocola aggregata]